MRTTTLALLVTAAMATAAGAAEISMQAPQAPLNTVGRAELLAARQSWPEAIAAYNEAIAADPQNAALHNRLGICYQRAGDLKAARAAYKKAVDLKPDLATAYNNIGSIDHSRGRYKQAISAYSKAIKIDATNAVFHKNLGSAWLARGSADKALEAWGEALRLDPASLDSAGVGVAAQTGVSLARQYYLFAKLCAERGEVERALAYLGKAQEAGFDLARIDGDDAFVKIVKDPRYATLR